LVKLPVFGFHIWLPKAHVEASVSGSILLAGVLLKLGGYGLYRFFFLFKNLRFLSFFITLFFFLGLYGGLFSAIFCYRQIDLKMIIAYSSVVHISRILIGLFSFSYAGVLGRILMMFSHGFISPILFFLITEMYVVIKSRSLFIIKGLLFLNSLFCFL